MGHVYALAGCSGVGKTTFLNALFYSPQKSLRLIPRATGRAMRPSEIEGFDYNFYSPSGFLQKIFANDFVHVEQHGKEHFGIETKPIEEAIRSDEDAIILAGILGATRLKSVFGGNVSVIYMHTDIRQSLLNPACLINDCPQNIELRRRLREKINKGIITLQEETEDSYIERRMQLNFVGLAYVNGRIRSGDDILVLENLRDKMLDTISQFNAYRKKTSANYCHLYSRTNVCFVLMPFKEQLLPVYTDHIDPIVSALGLDCLRADGIFSNRPVMNDILETVKNARIVISDLTELNPNVLYETGICHALGKEVILITQDSDVPFDLRHIRHIKYEYTPRGMVAFERALKHTLEAILNS